MNLKFEKFKLNFGSLNEFKWKSCELQNFIATWDLQLCCSEFFHPMSFAKFDTKSFRIPSERYYSSFETFRLVNIICDKICKTFSFFYHSLHIWCHYIMTNLIIFRLYLLNLKTIRAHACGRVSWTKCSKILFILQV